MHDISGYPIVVLYTYIGLSVPSLTHILSQAVLGTSHVDHHCKHSVAVSPLIHFHNSHCSTEDSMDTDCENVKQLRELKQENQQLKERQSKRKWKSSPVTFTYIENSDRA